MQGALLVCNMGYSTCLQSTWRAKKSIPLDGTALANCPQMFSHFRLINSACLKCQALREHKRVSETVMEGQ